MKNKNTNAYLFFATYGNCFDNLRVSIAVQKSTEYNLDIELPKDILFTTISELLSSEKYQKILMKLNILKIIFGEDRVMHLICQSDYGDSVLYSLNESRLPENKSVDPEFGLPEKKKYPLFDKAHVLSAIKFFNYTEGEDSKILARAIKKKMKQYGISDDSVGEDNRLKEYL